MTNKTYRGTCIALPLLMLSPLSQAFQVEMDGPGSLSIDSTISYGLLWRMEDQNPSNDGINDNDGNRNYGKGLVSQVLSLSTEVNWDFDNYGFFLRGAAHKDFEMSGNTHFGKESFHDDQPSAASNSGTAPNNRFTDDARDSLGQDAEILDAYLYGYTDIGNTTVSGKLGRHVLYWGESLFYRNGIGDINAVDAAKLKLPGVGIKEALLPSNSLSLNLGINENLDLEGFYMFEYRETRLSPVGSFYSTGDMFAPGGNAAYRGFNNPLSDAVLNAHQSLVDNGLLTETYLDANYLKVANINDPELASDSGQFGVGMRYRVPELNETEFGFYYTNYHNKTPIVSASINDTFFQNVGNISGPAGLVAALTAAELGANTEAHRKYLEDVEVMGVSFNTMVGETVVAGELAYRPDMPITVASSDDLIADLQAQTTDLVAGQNIMLGGQSFNPSLGESIDNYTERDVYNATLSATHNLGYSAFSDQLIAIAEIGYEHINGDLSYDVYDGSTRRFVSKAGCASTSDCAEDGEITRDAWGYSLALSSTWNGVFTGTQLKGLIRYKHDVNGNSHRSGNFVEGTQALTIGVGATIYGDWSVDAKYTDFFGGTNNKLRDRDSLSLTAAYAF